VAKLIDKQVDIIEKLATLARHLEKFIENGGTERPKVANDNEEVKHGSRSERAGRTENSNITADMRGF
jgi:hypothetical protein